MNNPCLLVNRIHCFINPINLWFLFNKHVKVHSLVIIEPKILLNGIFLIMNGKIQWATGWNAAKYDDIRILMIIY
jgi:hypothetical protein